MIFRLTLLCAVAFWTSGAVRADELTPDSIFGEFERGGKIMWAILAFSVIGCAFAAERFLVIRRGAQIPKRLMSDLREAMVSGGVSAGLEVVEGDRSAMGRVMAALLSRSGATRRELETTVDEEGSRILHDLRANLRPIGVIAALAPQLGLLGTVFGLIAAFRSAAELGMDDPRNFAAGIYEALYTTAFGLVVAIPLLVIYHLLRNHADRIMREVEDRSLAFISAASGRAGGAGRQPEAGEKRTGGETEEQKQRRREKLEQQERQAQKELQQRREQERAKSSESSARRKFEEVPRQPESKEVRADSEETSVDI